MKRLTLLLAFTWAVCTLGLFRYQEMAPGWQTVLVVVAGFSGFGAVGCWASRPVRDDRVDIDGYRVPMGEVRR